MVGHGTPLSVVHYRPFYRQADQTVVETKTDQVVTCTNNAIAMKYIAFIYTQDDTDINFAITLYGQCCRRHLVWQRIVSDIEM